MLAGMSRCTSPNFRIVAALCLLSITALSAHALSAERSAELSDAFADERIIFQSAVKELRSGAGPRYESRRAALNNYPLTPYLDALAIEGNLHDVTSDSVRAFVESASNSPVAARTLRSVVRHKTADRKWQTVIDVTDGYELSTELQCHRAHALLMTNQAERATTILTHVWVVSQSQIKACDPVFSEWYRRSGPSDDVVWSRALKAADARNMTLLRYLNRFASTGLKPSLSDLGAMVSRPDRVTQKTRGAIVRQQDIAVAGIKRLARVNPGRAFEALQQLERRFSFSDEQMRAMHSPIVRHSLFAKSAAPIEWLMSRLPALGDDELTEIYLRSTIANADWEAFRIAFQWLSVEKQATDEWRYWRVMAAGPGEATRSEAELNELASGRGFHAYLAAEALGLPLTLGSHYHAQSSADAEALEVEQRVLELNALGMRWEATSEFRSALSDPAIALRLADLAAALGWHSLAIEAAAAAKAWGRLDLRFPMVFASEFQNASQESGLGVEELIAIARRESALSPSAVSEVGARGLMQLMPSTARLTARKHNYRYSRSRLMVPSYNTAVGALYYRDLLTRYEGNRLQALAAYNAGPNRVRRWINGDMSAARWVDTIPFKETREYVRAVMAYNVIYRLKAGKPAQLLSQAERDYQY